MTSVVHHRPLSVGRPVRDPIMFWLAWAAAALAGAGLLAAGLMTGDTYQRTPVVSGEPFENARMIAQADLPGHTLEGMAVGDLTVSDSAVLTTPNVPVHLIEDAIAGYVVTDRAAFRALPPYEDPAVIAGANLPAHVLEGIARGEISSSAGAEVFTTTNIPAHLLEEMIVGD